MRNDRRYRIRLVYEVNGASVTEDVTCETEEEASLKWKENMVGQTKIFGSGMTFGILSARNIEVESVV